MEKTVDKKNIYKGKILDLDLLKVELPNNKTAHREIINNADAVVILAMDDEDNIFFVKQYRKAIEEYLLELPAGKIEEGETPEFSAKRELAEEIGYSTDKFELLFSFYSSPGFSKEKIYAYKAVNLFPHERDGDDDEFIEVIKLPFSEAIENIKNNKITDVKTISTILYYNQFNL
jgi:ADP-ribose pyrophosphatase